MLSLHTTLNNVFRCDSTVRGAAFGRSPLMLSSIINLPDSSHHSKGSPGDQLRCMSFEAALRPQFGTDDDNNVNNASISSDKDAASPLEFSHSMAAALEYSRVKAFRYPFSDMDIEDTLMTGQSYAGEDSRLPSVIMPAHNALGLTFGDDAEGPRFAPYAHPVEQAERLSAIENLIQRDNDCREAVEHDGVRPALFGLSSLMSLATEAYSDDRQSDAMDWSF